MTLSTRRLAALLVAHTVLLAAPLTAQVTGRASVATSGTAAAGGDSSDPSISDNGRLVAFTSAATNLAADANGVADVFVHDRQAGTTVLVSRSTAGVAANAASGSPSVSGDGRFVVFVSSATNLFAGAPVPSAYAHDLVTGITSLVPLPAGFVVDLELDDRRVVSTNQNGGLVVVSGRRHPAAVLTIADREVFVVDRETGTLVTRVTGHRGVLSADGRYLAYDSTARPQAIGLMSVRVLDRLMSTTTELAPPMNSQADECGYPAISADGRWVAFECLRQPNLNGFTQGSKVYLFDRVTGTVADVGAPSGVSTYGSAFVGDLSADGRYLVFNSQNPVTGSPVGGNQVFRYDRVAQTWSLISASTVGAVQSFPSFAPSLSADGQIVAFGSAATVLTAGDGNGFDDIFIADPSCAFLATPSSLNVAGAGGTAMVDVSTSPHCSWVASSAYPWIVAHSAAGVGGGTGSGSLVMTIAPNTSATQRIGQVNVAGRSITVTQPPGCSIALSATRPVAPASGRTGVVRVTAGLPSCAWSATSNAGWLTLNPLNGTGTADVLFFAAANTGPDPRAATISVENVPIVITQSGTSCTTTASPTSVQVPAAGGSVAVSVTSSLPGCPWENFAGASWVTLGSTFGVGNGTTTLQVAPNPSSSSRSTMLGIANSVVSVTQAAAPGPNDPPGPPQQLSSVVTGNVVALSWIAPAAGSTPTGYTIEAGTAAGLGNLVVFPTGNTATTFAAQAPNGTYFVRARATSPFGTSPPSNEVMVTVGCTAAPVAPGTLNRVIAGNRVSLSWSASPGTTSYLVTVGSSPNASDIATLRVPGVTVTADAPPGLYYVRIFAENACGLSGPSNEVTVAVGGTEPPEAPTALRATVTGNMLRLVWNAPTSGPPITGYVLEAGATSGLSNLARLPLGNGSSFEIGGVPGGTYYVRVRAVNGGVAGPPSNEAIVQVQ